MRAELDEQDLERIAQEIEREVQHWVGIIGFFILVKLNELETHMAAIDEAVARNTTSAEALIAALNQVLANQGTDQGAIDALNAESDKMDAAVASVPAPAA